MCTCRYIYMSICTHTISKLCFSSGKDNQNQSITAGFSPVSWDSLMGVQENVEQETASGIPSSMGTSALWLSNLTSQIGLCGLIILTYYLIISLLPRCAENSKTAL